MFLSPMFLSSVDPRSGLNGDFYDLFIRKYPDKIRDILLLKSCLLRNPEQVESEVS